MLSCKQQFLRFHSDLFILILLLALPPTLGGSLKYWSTYQFYRCFFLWRTASPSFGADFLNSLWQPRYLCLRLHAHLHLIFDPGRLHLLRDQLRAAIIPWLWRMSKVVHPQAICRARLSTRNRHLIALEKEVISSALDVRIPPLLIMALHLVSRSMTTLSTELRSELRA